MVTCERNAFTVLKQGLAQEAGGETLYTDKVDFERAGRHGHSLKATQENEMSCGLIVYMTQ
jgi:hypothetical protein